MKLKKLKLKLIAYLIILQSFLVSGCALTPPNIPICREKDIDRGRCTYIVSGKSFEINEVNKFEGKTWHELRPYFILVPISSWAELKSYIVKMCKKFKNCPQAEPTVNSIDTMIVDPD